MKDDQLNRLLRAASKADPVPPPAADIPFGFDTRVIAHWKSQSGQGAELVRFTMFRRALAAACAVALTTVLIGYRTLETAPSPELALADYSLESSDTL